MNSTDQDRFMVHVEWEVILEENWQFLKVIEQIKSQKYNNYYKTRCLDGEGKNWVKCSHYLLVLNPIYWLVTSEVIFPKILWPNSLQNFSIYINFLHRAQKWWWIAVKLGRKNVDKTPANLASRYNKKGQPRMKKTLNAQRRNEMNAITIEIQMRFAFLQLQLAKFLLSHWASITN